MIWVGSMEKEKKKYNTIKFCPMCGSDKVKGERYGMRCLGECGKFFVVE